MARPCKMGGKTEAENKKTKEDFEKLCAMQCTEEEICAWFDVTDKTLSGWCQRTYGTGFSEVYDKKREVGKISLRRAQFRLAEKSAAVAIWLGKQYLGQRDSVQFEDKESIDRLDMILATMRATAGAGATDAADTETE